MSTTPTPIPAVTFVEKWIALVKAHEKLVLILVAAFLSFHFYGSALTAWVNHDEKVQAIDQAKAKALMQQNALIAQQSAELIAAVKASNAALAQAAQQRAEQTKANQVADQSLPLPQLGQRWVSLLNVGPAEIAAQPDGSMKVSDTASRTTVEQLEVIPQLKQDLAGAQQTTQNNQKVIDQQTTQIASDKTTIAANDKACQDQINTLKADKKKSFWRGSKFGSIVTIIAYEAFRVAAGHP